MEQAARFCPECGREMEFRLGGFECFGCGRMIIPAELVPEPPPTAAQAMSPEVFAQAAAAHAAAPAVPLLPTVYTEPKTMPQGYPFPLTAPPPPQAALAARPAVINAASLPLDENTSGQGSAAILPPEANRYTMAGWLPLGIFSFYTGDMLWGAIGLIGTFTGLPLLVYGVYIPYEGRKRAWRMRRFASVAEFNAVMELWHWAGLLVTLLTVVFAAVVAYQVYVKLMATPEVTDLLHGL